MSIGKQIKKIRLENKLTQAQFAEIMGLEQAQISEYENDKVKPSKVFMAHLKHRYIDIPSNLVVKNGSNILGRCSFAIPGPLSDISMRTHC